MTNGFACSGTLIGENTIITSAACLRSTLNYENNGTISMVPVIPSNYYSTIPSMFRVFLGIKQQSEISFNYAGTSEPGKVFMVSRVTKVKQNLKQI